MVEPREGVLGLATRARNERVKTQYRLFVLFEGHAGAAEIRRLKAQDQGF